MPSTPTIPMYFSVDVEPDAFQLPRDGTRPVWTGFDRTVEVLQRLRTELASRTGVAPHFGWYVRTDPQVAAVYGSGDYLFRERADCFAQLGDQGDYFGVHCHPLRWSDQRGAWVNDVSDDDWIAECTQFSLDRFADWSGAAAQRYRWGASYISNTTVAVLDANGVALDLTLEPLTGWALTSSAVATAVDDAPVVGSYVDCGGAPRVPYRPSRADFLVPSATGDGRKLTIVPVSTWSAPREGPPWKQVGRRIKGSPTSTRRILYPSQEWPVASEFWDAALREISRSSLSYLSIAIRTDDPRSAMYRDVERICLALARHPMADRVRLVDPLDHVGNDLVAS